VTEEIQETRFNTAISAMMEFINAAYKVIITYFLCLFNQYESDLVPLKIFVLFSHLTFSGKISQRK
jgi:hypothetical protein